MQLKVPFALVLAGMGLAVASCSTDEITVPKSELYTREFIKQFGVFDPNHEWNHAQRVNVTVTTSTPTDIKIYATVNGTRYLFGTFLGVNGSRDLGVDIPKGITALTLRANGNDYSITPGASITLGGRGARDIIPSGPGEGIVSVTPAPEDATIIKDGEYIGHYADILPESPAHSLGKPGISLNFSFVSDGEGFTIYPVMWTTSVTNTLGVYYTYNGTYYEQDVYTIKSGNFLEARTLDWSPAGWAKTDSEGNKYVTFEMTAGNNDYVVANYFKDIFEEKSNCADWTDEDWQKGIDKMNASETFKLILFEKPGQWSVKTLQDGTEDSEASTRVKCFYEVYNIHHMSDVHSTLVSGKDPKDVEYISHGIQVKFPEAGIKYGMYIRTGNNRTYYSEASKNKDMINYVYDFTESTDENGKTVYTEGEKRTLDYSYNAPYAATFTRDDLDNSDASRMRRVCFEDCPVETEDSYGDYNDMVFYISGIDEQQIEEEPAPWEPEKPYEWVVACEDLGATDDFDFNDVVFGVSNYKEDADGNASVDVRPLAAGGTLEIYLMRTNLDEPIGNKEFHQLFGESSLKPINVGGEASSKSDTYTISVEKGFTMSCCREVKDGNMGGFYVKVVKDDGREVYEIKAPDLNKNAQNEAPQMICVPTHWLWPTERTHILNPYPKFEEWVKKQDNCPDWHENPGAGVIRRTDIPSNTNKPDGGWGSGGQG